MDIGKREWPRTTEELGLAGDREKAPRTGNALGVGERGARGGWRRDWGACMLACCV